MSEVVDPNLLLGVAPPVDGRESLAGVLGRQAKLDAQSTRLRIGVVTARSPSTRTVSVLIAGASTAVAGIPVANGFVIIGATVTLLQTAGSYVVVGTINTDLDWTTLPLTSGWNAYGSTYQVPQYRREGDKVYLRGLVQRTAGQSTVVALSPFAVLPAGFAPPLNGDMVFESRGAPTGSGESGQGVFVSSTGNLSCSTSSMAATGYLYINVGPISVT